MVAGVPVNVPIRTVFNKVSSSKFAYLLLRFMPIGIGSSSLDQQLEENFIMPLDNFFNSDRCCPTPKSF